MSIATAITAAQGRVANAYTAISNKGGTLPATQDLANMPTAIDSIPSGGQEEIVTAINKTGSVINTGDKVWLNQESGYSYNFDVVGGLEVNNETSVISNFSTTNYLQLKNAFNPQSSSWEVLCKFTAANVTTQQSIFKSGMSAPEAVGRFGVGVEINASHFRISASSNGTSWNIAHDLAGSYTVLANTTYWVKLGWSGTQYYLEYSTDGETFTRDITVSSSTAVYGSLGVTLLGLNWWNDAYQAPFLGTIDLSGTKITIGGSDWWVPSITKISDWSAVTFDKQDYSYDLDINGSLTIDYGVVSGFSSSNYLSKTTAPDSWNISDYTFYCKFTSKASSANQNIVAGSVMLQEQSGYVKTWNGSTVINLFVVNSGKTYFVKVVVSGTTQTFYYSTDGVVYTQCYTGTFPASTFNIAQVGYRASSGAYVGSIDLKGMYLKNTSDNTVWYAMADNSLIGFAKENIAVHAAGNVGVGMLIDEKYGATVDNLLGDVDANGVYQLPTDTSGDIVFTGIKKFGTCHYAMYYKFFGYTNLTHGVSFPDLEEADSQYCLYYSFSGTFITSFLMPKLTKVSGISALYDVCNSTKITSVSLPELIEVTASDGLRSAFSNNTLMTSFSASKLKTVSGANALYYLCSGDNNLTSIDLSALETANIGYALGYFCQGCSKLPEMRFTKLNSIAAGRVFYGAFNGCKEITDIYFNALTTTSFGSQTNQFNNMFNTSSMSTSGNVNIHFPSNLQSTISGLQGYPNFGATAGRVTLLFDLAATS